MEEALISSKLDAIGAEYSARIQSQLEEQRAWFDGRHAQTLADCETRLAAAEAGAAACRAAALDCERQRKTLEFKLVRQFSCCDCRLSVQTVSAEDTALVLQAISWLPA